MKKLVFILFICLMFVLSGCVEIEIRNPEEYEKTESSETAFADNRSFALSDEAASNAVSLAGSGAMKSEICAYYDDIVTYKVSFDDGLAEFYNYKILSEDGYSLEFISKRAADGTFCGFSDLCEFYPTAADGYPEKALAPVYYWELPDIGIEKAEDPGKVSYTVTAVGSGQSFTEKEHIEKICGAVEQIKIFPIERFFTDYEKILYIDLEANTFEYFANSDDESPLYTLYIELFRIDSNDEKGRMYYVYDDTAFSENLNDIYFGLIDEIIEETFHNFTLSSIEEDFIFGHTGDALFSGGKLWLSAYTYDSANTEFIANRQFVFDLEADTFTFIDLDENDEYHSHSYIDDFSGNMYHLVGNNYSEDTPEYVLYSLDESGAVTGSKELTFEGFGISHITNDLNGNWYIDSLGDIRIFDSAFNEIFHADYPDIANLFRLPDGRVCAVFENEINIFDPADFGFCESHKLSNGAHMVFPGNSEYDIFYTDNGNSVYGVNFGNEPQFIIMLDRNGDEYAVMQLYMDENGDLYTVGNTDKLRHGATEIYKFEINK